eukprot:3323326-Pleurochrysis_carterae.AAC.1
MYVTAYCTMCLTCHNQFINGATSKSWSCNHTHKYIRDVQGNPIRQRGRLKKNIDDFSDDEGGGADAARRQEEEELRRVEAGIQPKSVPLSATGRRRRSPDAEQKAAAAARAARARRLSSDSGVRGRPS